MKINPGFLKLDLFCKGMRVDGSCQLQKDGRPVLHMRGGLGSGLELILPGGLYINVPLEEHFVKDTPYLLLKKNESYVLEREGAIICRVKLPPRPKFYDSRTSSGKLMSRIGLMQGTYLGIYPTRVCEFWSMQPRMNCKFCSVGLNVGNTEEWEKSVRDVVETVKAARKEEKITFVHFNTGFLLGQELDILTPYIEAVKRETGLLVGVQCPPSPELNSYNRLKKMGVDHLSFCLEVYDRQRFKEVCPGKDRYLGQRAYLEAVRYCSRIFGKGRVSGELIAGLEDPESTIKAIEHFAEMGAVSTVCIFRPCLGTGLEACPPPDTKTMIPVFRRLYEVCLEKKIPIGIAPNIKVSLVLLAEEGRYFLERHNIAEWLLTLRLGILKVIYRVYFRIRMALFK